MGGLMFIEIEEWVNIMYKFIIKTIYFVYILKSILYGYIYIIEPSIKTF